MHLPVFWPHRSELLEFILPIPLFDSTFRIQAKKLMAFQVALRAVPCRSDFYARVSQGGSIEKFNLILARWLVALDALVKHLRLFLEDGGYGKL